jgi:hypothetical protein
MAIGSHPLGFKLLNLDGNAVLGIFDGKGQTSKLNIKNTSRRDWSLKKLTSEVPSAANHHFELKFRLGTLNLNPKNPIKVDATDAKWKISDPVTTTDAVSFYLLSASATPFIVKKEESTVVMLHNLNADGSDGARGTRVEFKWSDRLEYEGNEAKELPAGHRVQHLSIVNERGEKAPLAVRIVSTDRVVNDGTTENKLTLRIASLIKEDIILYPENDPVYPASKFTFWFDTETKDSDKEWTLAPKSQLEKIDFVVPTDMKPGRDAQGTAPTWWITPKQRFTLTPDKSIQVTFNKITTSNPAGKCNLYARCQNIPAYRDGDFVSLVEKSPVVYKDQNVGIGTINPAKHLHVCGDNDQEVMIESTNGVQWTLQSSGDGTGRFEIIKRTAPQLSCLSILKDGNVGIGTIDPKSKLHVNGKLRVDGDPWVKGKLGIGTDTPERTLHVAGLGDQEIMIESTDDYNDDGIRGIKWTLQSSAAASGGRFEIINRTHGVNRFTIQADGGVGIGTVSPTKAALVVAYSGANVSMPNGYREVELHKCENYHGARSAPYSIWSEGRIAASLFNAVSDARIKNIQGRSDSATDLSTLLGIEVTDYTYKDVIGKGTGTYKKVLGQQIEQVFPQAINRVTDVVPDIYQQASMRDGWVALSTDLKQGDRVKLITAQGESVHEVLEVDDDKFRVGLDHEDDTIFVFGREVNDFLTVDYDALSMLNVSATQQLKKELDHEVKLLRAENAELRATNDSLARRLELLESRLEAALGVTNFAGGSNGNGWHKH